MQNSINTSNEVQSSTTPALHGGVKVAEQPSFQLVDSDFGYDDYDVRGCEIHRAKVVHLIKVGDIFNVYGPGSTKRGATWLGSIEKSVQAFLNKCAEEAQATQTVYAVAVESESSGSVDWYRTREAAEAEYENSKVLFASCPCETITLFELAVASGLSSDAITDLVDDAMHEQEYCLLMRHETSQSKVANCVEHADTGTTAT